MMKVHLPVGDAIGQGLYSQSLSTGLSVLPTETARVMGRNPTSFGPFPRQMMNPQRHNFVFPIVLMLRLSGSLIISISVSSKTSGFRLLKISFGNEVSSCLNGYIYISTLYFVPLVGF